MATNKDDGRGRHSDVSAAPPNGEAVVSSMSVTATVTKIDQKTREVTLKTEGGEAFTRSLARRVA